jgi:hypothetical protein
MESNKPKIEFEILRDDVSEDINKLFRSIKITQRKRNRNYC